MLENFVEQDDGYLDMCTMLGCRNDYEKKYFEKKTKDILSCLFS